VSERQPQIPNLRPPGSILGAENEYGPLKKLLLLWDLSGDARDNEDRVKKLGHFDGTKANAILDYEEAKARNILSDGYQNDMCAAAPFEPDNWTPRLHENRGHGNDVVWALRLIVDHKNRDSERGHRSTMLVDQ